MSQLEIFDIAPTICMHALTGTKILANKSIWIKGKLHFKCLVPQEDEKGKKYFANATYSDNELKFKL